MKYNKKIHRRQVLALAIFSLMSSFISIVHGIFFDLEFSQISRITIWGLVFTWTIFFPGFLLLEWIFDIDNNDAIKKMEKKLAELDRELDKLNKENKS